MKKIKFVIESRLDNVSLVGMSINKLCSLTSLSERQLFQIELCAVEAMNNSIIHAYNGELTQEVEITFTIKEDHISLEVCDKGEAMDREVLDYADLDSLPENIDNPEIISETGRGLGVIKKIMDEVAYRSDDSGNHLVMVKYF